MAENRVLRRIYGPEWEKVARGCRRLHDEGRYNLYTSLNISGVARLKTTRLREYVACKE
jgi:hypothetical protein